MLKTHIIYEENRIVNAPKISVEQWDETLKEK